MLRLQALLLDLVGFLVEGLDVEIFDEALLCRIVVLLLGLIQIVLVELLLCLL